MIAPIYSQLSLDYPDIAFAKVDVDDLDTTAQAAGIRVSDTMSFLHRKRNDAYCL